MLQYAESDRVIYGPCVDSVDCKQPTISIDGKNQSACGMKPD